MNTTHNTVLVAGGGTGLGLALAERLIAPENQVLTCGQREQPIRSANERFPSLHIRQCVRAEPHSH